MLQDGSSWPGCRTGQVEVLLGHLLTNPTNPVALLLTIHTPHFEQHRAHFCVYVLTRGCPKLLHIIPTLSLSLGHACVNQFQSLPLPTTMIMHSNVTSHLLILYPISLFHLHFPILIGPPHTSYLPPNLTKRSLTPLLSITTSRSSTPYSRFPDSTSTNPAPLSVFLFSVPVHAALLALVFSLLRWLVIYSSRIYVCLGLFHSRFCYYQILLPKNPMPNCQGALLMQLRAPATWKYFWHFNKLPTAKHWQPLATQRVWQVKMISFQPLPEEKKRFAGMWSCDLSQISTCFICLFKDL